MEDLLVKIKEEVDHTKHLAEAFNILRKFQMKLNPAKCAFGVLSGKFLGHLVSRWGIEANPETIQAVINMRSPRKTKEVKSLAERIAALNRFVSRATDRCLPFFKVLRKAFEWLEECKQAFQELNKYLPSSSRPLYYQHPFQMRNCTYTWQSRLRRSIQHWSGKRMESSIQFTTDRKSTRLNSSH